MWIACYVTVDHTTTATKTRHTGINGIDGAAVACWYCLYDVCLVLACGLNLLLGRLFPQVWPSESGGLDLLAQNLRLVIIPEVICARTLNTFLSDN
jgi:hypothetical protein